MLETRRAEIESRELAVFMVDEYHLLWGDSEGYVWGQKKERVSIPIVNEKERQTYFGGLDYNFQKSAEEPYKLLQLFE